MNRRNAIAATAAVFVGGACYGALGALSGANGVPVSVKNYSESEKRVTIAILEQDSEEQVFSRTVEMTPDEETEFPIEGLQGETTYDVVASTQSGASDEYIVSTNTRELWVEVYDDGLSVSEVVT